MAAKVEGEQVMAADKLRCDVIETMGVACQTVQKQRDWLALSAEVSVVKPQIVDLNKLVFDHSWSPAATTRTSRLTRAAE